MGLDSSRSFSLRLLLDCRADEMMKTVWFGSDCVTHSLFFDKEQYSTVGLLWKQFQSLEAGNYVLSGRATSAWWDLLALMIA